MQPRCRADGARRGAEPASRGPPSRGPRRYSRTTINAILDEGLFGHAAFVADGQPYAIPMLYARHGDVLYLHGSPLSRLLSSLAGGVPMCFTVTLLDGLVLARSAFHHSLNYRSVVVLGRGRAIGDADDKREALRTLVDHVAPGRSHDARGPNEKELEATEVVMLPLDEASAKVRTGGAVDAPEDYSLAVWAGEVPLRLIAEQPLTDERCAQPVPDYVSDYRRGHA